jgi:hypothetical protein
MDEWCNATAQRANLLNKKNEINLEKENGPTKQNSEIQWSMSTQTILGKLA